VQLRVKGKGMPKYNNTAEYGDLFVKIQYKIPVNLSEEEKQLLGKLREINNAKNAD